jgi:hypothetical protein
MNQEIELPETRPYVEFLMTADRAEAINGKLYLMGGAWDRLWIGDFATQPHPVGIAICVVVPWSATNEDHRLSVMITNDDEVEVASTQIGFRAGASAQMARTESQKVLLALTMQPRLERPGTYTIKAIVDDDSDLRRSRETFFYVKPRSAT